MTAPTDALDRLSLEQRDWMNHHRGLGWNASTMRRKADLEALAAALEREAALRAELESLRHFPDLPCGHSSMWAYTENGGKVICCLLCIKAERDALAEQVRALTAKLEDK